MSYEELTDYLYERGMTDTAVFSPPISYSEAVVGITEDERVVYSYDKMVKCLTADGMDYSEAAEFIDYNTLRTLPYMGDKAPVIMYDID